MPTHPRRRWFQFSLATLLVVMTLFAAIAGWLAWEMNFVQQRRSMCAIIEGRGGYAVSVAQAKARTGTTSSNSIPIWRIWLGDEPYLAIGLGNEQSKEDLQLATELFPEAEVRQVGGPVGGIM